MVTNIFIYNDLFYFFIFLNLLYCSVLALFDTNSPHLLYNDSFTYLSIHSCVYLFIYDLFIYLITYLIIFLFIDYFFIHSSIHLIIHYLCIYLSTLTCRCSWNWRREKRSRWKVSRILEKKVVIKIQIHVLLVIMTLHNLHLLHYYCRYIMLQ